jgi:hypothetical protein
MDKELRKFTVITVVILVRSKYTPNFSVNIQLIQNHIGLFTEFPIPFLSVYIVHCCTVYTVYNTVRCDAVGCGVMRRRYGTFRIFSEKAVFWLILFTVQSIEMDHQDISQFFLIRGLAGKLGD